jgi:hypothetical protein
VRRDGIAAVAVDDSGRLHVYPRTETFPYIWREAMEVYWDVTRNSLHSPVPREWSHADWFVQLLEAARQQGVHLAVDTRTEWRNIDATVRERFLEQEAAWLAKRPGGTKDA